MTRPTLTREVVCGCICHWYNRQPYCVHCEPPARADEPFADLEWPEDVPPSEPVAPFRDCTCYVVNGEITPESRARCPRHTTSASTK